MHLQSNFHRQKITKLAEIFSNKKVPLSPVEVPPNTVNQYMEYVLN